MLEFHSKRMSLFMFFTVLIISSSISDERMTWGHIDNFYQNTVTKLNMYSVHMELCGEADNNIYLRHSFVYDFYGHAPKSKNYTNVTTQMYEQIKTLYNLEYGRLNLLPCKRESVNFWKKSYEESRDDLYKMLDLYSTNFIIGVD